MTLPRPLLDERVHKKSSSFSMKSIYSSNTHTACLPRPTTEPDEPSLCNSKNNYE